MTKRQLDSENNTNTSSESVIDDNAASGESARTLRWVKRQRLTNSTTRQETDSADPAVVPVVVPVEDESHQDDEDDDDYNNTDKDVSTDEDDDDDSGSDMDSDTDSDIDDEEEEDAEESNPSNVFQSMYLFGAAAEPHLTQEDRDFVVSDHLPGSGFCKSQCQCNICTDMNRAVSEWQFFQPQNRMQERIRDVADRIAQRATAFEDEKAFVDGKCSNV